MDQTIHFAGVLEYVVSGALLAWLLAGFTMFWRLGQVQSWQSSHDEVDKVRGEAHNRELKALREEIRELKRSIDGTQELAQAIRELADALNARRGFGSSTP